MDSVSVSGITTKPIVSVASNSGAATFNIPIEVPPGRAGVAPNLALAYHSSQENGMLGVGFHLGLGAIQRATKRGVNYNTNDYVFIGNGAYSELVPRGDWGANYFGAKIEGAFAKYYKDPAGGWIVTAKDGTKYYYGYHATALSTQDNAHGTFKWCLDRVEDTNGNYMEITYSRDNGEVYPERIDYTGHVNGLKPTNYVRFYYDNSRTDAPPMYGTNAAVRTTRLLRTIDVGAANGRARAYKLTYTPSVDSGRSLLSEVLQYGINAVVNGNTGEITSGTTLPPVTIQWQTFQWENTARGYKQVYGRQFSTVGSAAIEPYYSRLTGDFDGDGKTDVAWSYSGQVA